MTDPSKLPLRFGEYSCASVAECPPKRVAISVEVQPNEFDGSDKAVELGEKIAMAVEKSSMNLMTELEGFDPVESGPALEAIIRANIASGDLSAIGDVPEADFLLLANTRVTYLRSGGKETSRKAHKAEGVELETTYALVDLKQKRRVVSETVVHHACGEKVSDVSSKIAEVAKMNANDLGKSIVAAFIPHQALEIRGEAGKRGYALVPAWKGVEFAQGTAFEFSETKQATPGTLISFAEGRLTGDDVKKAKSGYVWIEFDVDSVKKNHFVTPQK